MRASPTAPLAEAENRRVELVSPDFAFGTWENVLVVEWRISTTAPHVDLLRGRMQEFAHGHPGGILYLAFVRETAPPPDDGARRALAQMLRDKGSNLLAGAVVFDGADFRGAFVRGVATSLVMLARPVFPFEVCKIEGAANLFSRVSATRGIPFLKERFVAEALALRSAFSERPPLKR